MDHTQITPDFVVSPQIAAGDISAIKAAGFRAIICNRPDDEEVEQPAFREIEKAARDAGIEARHIPIVGGNISEADVAAFRAALEDLPYPIFAYCRSGRRSETLWNLAEGTRAAAPGTA